MTAHNARASTASGSAAQPSASFGSLFWFGSGNQGNHSWWGELNVKQAEGIPEVSLGVGGPEPEQENKHINKRAAGKGSSPSATCVMWKSRQWPSEHQCGGGEQIRADRWTSWRRNIDVWQPGETSLKSKKVHSLRRVQYHGIRHSSARWVFHGLVCLWAHLWHSEACPCSIYLSIYCTPQTCVAIHVSSLPISAPQRCDWMCVLCPSPRNVVQIREKFTEGWNLFKKTALIQWKMCCWLKCAAKAPWNRGRTGSGHQYSLSSLTWEK